MANREVSGYSVSMKLGNGYGTNVKLTSVSIGALSSRSDEYDKDKAFAVAAALSRAYTQVLVKVEETTKALLTN